MAYTKIINIKVRRHLKQAVNYAMNAEKTTEADIRYVSGLNCFPETATEKMLSTKAKYGKDGGRIGYHIIQSFYPNETTPEMAHQVGKEYAEKWLSDYEVVVSTHCDQTHVHNHFIINSVSPVHGRKFHLTKKDFYDKLYGISNDICRKNGLTTPLEFVDSSRMSRAEYFSRRSGKRSLKHLAIDDVETCIGYSRSIGELYTRLEDLGYEVVATGKYPKIRPPEGRKFFRLNTIGYSTETLMKRIAGNERPRPVRAPRRLRLRYPLQRPRRKVTKLEAIYLYYMYLLGKIRKNPRRSTLPVSEYRKFDTYKQQLRFIARNGIKGINHARQIRSELESGIEVHTEENKQLRAGRDQYKQLFAAHSIFERYRHFPDKLDSEQKSALKKAKEVMQQYGYEKNPDAIREIRAELSVAIEKNRQAIFAHKRSIKQLDELIAFYGQARENLRVHEQRRREEQTREDKKLENKIRP